MRASCDKLNEKERCGEALENQILQRLDRLERKMDDMGRVLIEIARTEERVARLMEADQKKTEWLLKLQERMEKLEREGGQHSVVMRWAERLFWVIVTAAASVFAWKVRDGG